MCIEHLLLLSFVLDAEDGGRLILQHVEKRKCPGLTWAKRITIRQEGAMRMLFADLARRRQPAPATGIQGSPAHKYAPRTAVTSTHRGLVQRDWTG